MFIKSNNNLIYLDEIINNQEKKHFIYSHIPLGYRPFILHNLMERSHKDVIYICSDGACLKEMKEQMNLLRTCYDLEVFPPWECLPYDRVCAHSSIIAQRLNFLSKIQQKEKKHPTLVLTTLNAIVQKVIPFENLRQMSQNIEVGKSYDFDGFVHLLTQRGYVHAQQVMEVGEFSKRGDLIDVFIPGQKFPLRLSFFGDELDQMRTFDPLNQCTLDCVQQVMLIPASEVCLSDESVRCFRSKYRENFGAKGMSDAIYLSISEKKPYFGMEHWMPLFYEKLETLFDYIPDGLVVFDDQMENQLGHRMNKIESSYQARCEAEKIALDDQVDFYRPVAPHHLYVMHEQWDDVMKNHSRACLSSLSHPTASHVFSLHGRNLIPFSSSKDQKKSVYDVCVQFIMESQEKGDRVVIAVDSPQDIKRFDRLFELHPSLSWAMVKNLDDVDDLSVHCVALWAFPLDQGFSFPGGVVISQWDIWGKRLRQKVSSRKADHFLRDCSEMTTGDLVVHLDHGIGRYDGLKIIQAGRAPHDCLQLSYHGGDKLFVPVENIDVLSRYGHGGTDAVLDKLGGAAWQVRKKKLQEKIINMAQDLIDLAAKRKISSGEAFHVPMEIYEEFCARFPYQETPDQMQAIQATIDDLGSSRPMDRLICGDVGFGKTEVAMRAALVTAMSGKQVALIAPTTVLVRQHYDNFKKRFQGLPIKIAQLSRLISSKQMSQTKQSLKDSQVDIVVGTHSLLGKEVKFGQLGLVIVDEEQHFGVKHKERLKELKKNVHVLTMTATPIPRTLQMALTGVKELSLITTPPVDRLAVQTFITPYDRVVIKEAIEREKNRAGQIFYVCPRIADLRKVADELTQMMPDLRFDMAHGKMSMGHLEKVMDDFYEHKLDLLLATNIIESGIDVPNANTMIIDRCDLFGLSQLYQLRGRIGRSHVRGYAYLTLSKGKVLTQKAQKRLDVMQTLDGLGAGFSLASYDMDIRGAGNLLGDEQSGHIKQVGIELYQTMLEEAVEKIKGQNEKEEETIFSPQINLGISVLIPDTYVHDLGLRLSLYRRLSSLETAQDIDDFSHELKDRFGPIPQQVDHLLAVVKLKQWCRIAHVEKIEAGPKGAVLSFYQNTYPNPQGLVLYLQSQSGKVKMRPDHSLVYLDRWDGQKDRLEGVISMMEKLAYYAQNI